VLKGDETLPQPARKVKIENMFYNCMLKHHRVTTCVLKPSPKVKISRTTMLKHHRVTNYLCALWSHLQTPMSLVSELVLAPHCCDRT
jgi:hypothetical protein